MINNYIIASFRAIRKHKTHYAINLFGLSAGLTACILIFLYIRVELSFDSFHKSADDIYRIESKWTFRENLNHWASTQGNIIPELSKRYPNKLIGAKFYKNHVPMNFSSEDISKMWDDILFADSTFFEVFEFSMIYGNNITCLNEINSIVISGKMSQQYFGDQFPLGRKLIVDKDTLTISAVFDDIPFNSHFHFDVVIPMSKFKQTVKDVDRAGPLSFYSYVKLLNNCNIDSISKIVNKEYNSIYGITEEDTLDTDFKGELFFNNIKDIHLQGHAEREIESNINPLYIKFFALIAIFILLLAAINYMNLSTALSSRRSIEVGMRKVVGASKYQILYQYLSESLILTFFAIIIALALVELTIPYFANFANIEIFRKTYYDTFLLFFLLAILIFYGTISGIYPAIVMSRFKPIKVLKSDFIIRHRGKKIFLLRRLLLVVQFTVSAFMIVFFLVMESQLRFINNKDVGFDKENVVIISLPEYSKPKEVKALMQEYQKLDFIKATASSSGIPGERQGVYQANFPHLKINKKLIEQFKLEDTLLGIEGFLFPSRVLFATEGIVKALGLKLTEGSSISEFNHDSVQGFIVNELTKDILSQDSLLLGTDIVFDYGVKNSIKGKICGIVKNFNYMSMHSTIDQLMIFDHPAFHKYLIIRLSDSVPDKYLSKIEYIYSDFFDQKSQFNNFFLKDFYDNIYTTEKGLKRLVGYFAGLALIIAALGLFGVISFFVVQRKKEINIRRILGANEISLIKNLSAEFILLVIISNIISFYPAYLVSNKWLSSFAYHVSVSFSHFLMAVGITLFISFATIGFRVYYLFRENPISSIKYE